MSRIGACLAVVAALVTAPQTAGAQGIDFGERTHFGPSEGWSDGAQVPVVTGPTFAGRTASVGSPRLEVDVDDDGDARWALTVPVEAEAPSRATFRGDALLEASVDGVVRARGASIVVDVPAGAHTIVVRGRRGSHEISHFTDDGFFAFAPLDIRHVALGRKSIVDAVSILADIPREKGGMTTASLAARVPKGWYVANQSDKDDTTCIPKGYTESTVRCEIPREHAHDDLRPSSLVATAASRDDTLTLRLDARSDLHRPLVIPGGPLVGIGGEINEGFRMRFGYELAVKSRHALLSASVDTDFAKNAVSALTLKGVMTNGFLGGGLGVPVRLAPELASGVRIEGDLFLGPVGFVTSADVWLFAPEKTHATFTLLGVVSF